MVSMDAPHDGIDVNSTTESNEDKGRRLPLGPEPPPPLKYSNTSAQNAREYFFLKLLRPETQLPPVSEPTLGMPSEVFRHGGPDRVSFHILLHCFKRDGLLRAAATSLPAGGLLYMLLQDFGLATSKINPGSLRDFLRYSGFTDKKGFMDMNAFAVWAGAFKLRETSNALIASAKSAGKFDGGPAGKFFQILADGCVSGFKLRTIVSAFHALSVEIPPSEADLLLQYPFLLSDQIARNAEARFIPAPRQSATVRLVLDKWQPLHRLMIFVALYMTSTMAHLRPAGSGSESSASSELEQEPSPD